MPSDDYMTIVYKILSYLYECQKAGKTSRREDYSPGSELIGDIPQSYWNSIMSELIKHGYINNAWVIDNRIGVPNIKTLPSTTLTLEGVEFLENNSAIAKVKSTMPTIAGIIQTIVSLI